MAKDKPVTVDVSSMRTVFFASAPNNLEPEHVPTKLFVSTFNKECKPVVELTDIDTLNQDSQKQMLYSDFEITRLLASGVKLHSINISSDTRLGITDDMIEDYNRRLESIADEMFNVESN